MVIDRQIPYDIEAEEAVIASALVDGNTVPISSAFVQGRDFYREKHAEIFAVAQMLYDRDGAEGVNQLTVAHGLGDKLDSCGGQTFLSDVIRRLPTSIGAEFYAKIVARAAMARRLISAGHAIMELGYSGPEDVTRAVDEAGELLHRLATGNPARARLQTAREILDDGLSAWFDRHMDSPSQLAGLPTGFTDLDNILDGWQRSSVYTIAAETSAGKSLFVGDRLLALSRLGHRCVLISSEMSSRAVGKRMVFQLAGLNPQTARLRGKYQQDEIEALQAAQSEFDRLPLVIRASGDLSYTTLRSELQMLKTRGLDVAVIDHIDHVGGSSDARARELELLMRDLKSLAEQLDIVIIVVSHLSRAVAGGGKISRLKNSSAKEQDSDVVMFLQAVAWQDGELVELTQEQAQMVKGATGRVLVRIEVYKNREGITGFVPLLMDWNRGGRFYPAAKQ